MPIKIYSYLITDSFKKTALPH